MTLEGRLKAMAARIGAEIKAMRVRLLPAGGTQGQVLAKTANTDYGVGWVDLKGLTLLGSITIGETALITAGAVRVLTATLATVKAGDQLLFVPTILSADKLTGPARCDTAGSVKVWVWMPGLAIAQSYTITGNLYRIG